MPTFSARLSPKSHFPRPNIGIVFGLFFACFEINDLNLKQALTSLLLPPNFTDPDFLPPLFANHLSQRVQINSVFKVIGSEVRIAFHHRRLADDFGFVLNHRAVRESNVYGILRSGWGGKFIRENAGHHKGGVEFATQAEQQNLFTGRRCLPGTESPRGRSANASSR